MGTTSTFLKSRVTKPTVGKWSSGFSAVKKCADDHKLPIIGVWSNGDVCGHCIAFEKSCMQKAFTDWQKTSGCVFWFGCSSDKTKDDKYEGTGFTWSRDDKLTMYPFVRVWWKAGKVDKCESGDWWDGGSDKGGATIVKKMKSLLKNFTPTTTTTQTPPATQTHTTPTETDSLKAQLDALRSAFETFTAQFAAQLDALAKKIG